MCIVLQCVKLLSFLPHKCKGIILFYKEKIKKIVLFTFTLCVVSTLHLNDAPQIWPIVCGHQHMSVTIRSGSVCPASVLFLSPNKVRCRNVTIL